MNPIIQNIMQMRNPLNNIIGTLSQMKGNPDQAFRSLMQSNPQFKQFVEANKGKSVEQIASENGIDLNAIRSLMK